MKKIIGIGAVVMLMFVTFFSGCLDESEKEEVDEIIKGKIVEYDVTGTAYSSVMSIAFEDGRFFKIQYDSSMPLYKNKLGIFKFKNLTGGVKQLLSVEYL